MNFIDRAIAQIAPAAAVKRMAARKTLEILNYGYGEGGGSTKKKSTRGWTAVPGNPQEDIDYNLYELRGRSRDLYMNSPLGTAALKTNKTNVIGPGLRLKSRIDSEFLGMKEEQADFWERQAEREFAIWAESKHCDAQRLSDFFDLQALAFLGALMNGDSFALFKRAGPQSWMPYTLRIHLIEADRVSTPWASVTGMGGGISGKNQSNGNWIYSGVEVDKQGMVVAYHICNTYPQSSFVTGEPRKWTRVEAFGETTGSPNLLQLMEAERAEQYRGVPYLAPVIETLKQLTRYTEAELMAAVIAGMFTVFIKSQGPSSDMPLGEMIPEEQRESPDDPNVYEMGPGAINVLGTGEDVQIANPGRPNAQFEYFVNALSRQIGAGLEIPQELLQKAFQSSYSASRAALLEAWKMFRTRRAWMAKEFCQPTYEEWLAEAVAIGRIKAPGFFVDPAIRKAWSKAEWNGPAPGQVDPLKEVQAAGKRIALCLSTREKETIELTGGDYDRNVKQLAREQAQLKEAGLLVEPADDSKGGLSSEEILEFYKERGE